MNRTSTSPRAHTPQPQTMPRYKPSITTTARVSQPTASQHARPGTLPRTAQATPLTLIVHVHSYNSTHRARQTSSPADRRAFQHKLPSPNPTDAQRQSRRTRSPVLRGGRARRAAARSPVRGARVASRRFFDPLSTLLSRPSKRGASASARASCPIPIAHKTERPPREQGRETREARSGRPASACGVKRKEGDKGEWGGCSPSSRRGSRARGVTSRRGRSSVRPQGRVRGSPSWVAITAAISSSLADNVSSCAVCRGRVGVVERGEVEYEERGPGRCRAPVAHSGFIYTLAAPGATPLAKYSTVPNQDDLPGTWPRASEGGEAPHRAVLRPPCPLRPIEHRERVRPHPRSTVEYSTTVLSSSQRHARDTTYMTSRSSYDIWSDATRPSCPLTCEVRYHSPSARVVFAGSRIRASSPEMRACRRSGGPPHPPGRLVAPSIRASVLRGRRRARRPVDEGTHARARWLDACGCRPDKPGALLRHGVTGGSRTAALFPDPQSLEERAAQRCSGAGRCLRSYVRPGGILRIPRPRRATALPKSTQTRPSPSLGAGIGLTGDVGSR